MPVERSAPLTRGFGDFLVAPRFGLEQLRADNAVGFSFVFQPQLGPEQREIRGTPDRPRALPDDPKQNRVERRFRWLAPFRLVFGLAPVHHASPSLCGRFTAACALSSGATSRR